jgi:hypothetical protein
MSDKLKGLAGSIAFGGFLAVASMALAQETQAPRGSQMDRGMMENRGMSGGMMSGDMQQMMANCRKMMQNDNASDSSKNPSSSGSAGNMSMSGDMQKIMGDCQKMMNSPEGSSSGSKDQKQ